jgi:hypothetical protein
MPPKIVVDLANAIKIPINLSDLMNHHADKLCELESEDSDTEIGLAPAYSHTHETQAPVRVRKLDLNATLMDFSKLIAQQVFATSSRKRVRSNDANRRNASASDSKSRQNSAKTAIYLARKPKAETDTTSKTAP